MFSSMDSARKASLDLVMAALANAPIDPIPETEEERSAIARGAEGIDGSEMSRRLAELDRGDE